MASRRPTKSVSCSAEGSRGLSIRSAPVRLAKLQRGGMVQRVAIAGFGAIGKVVAAHLDRGIDGLSLAAVSARDIARATAVIASFGHPVPGLPLGRPAGEAPIVVQ